MQTFEILDRLELLYPNNLRRINDFDWPKEWFND